MIPSPSQSAAREARGPERALLEIDGPRAALADVLGDAPEDLPAVGHRGLDDERHVRRALPCFAVVSSVSTPVPRPPIGLRVAEHARNGRGPIAVVRAGLRKSSKSPRVHRGRARAARRSGRNLKSNAGHSRAGQKACYERK